MLRSKPTPIPAIRPVPEYAADDTLSAVYARTMDGFGVPWMGVVAMAFAHYPHFYKQLWSGFEPVVVSQDFDDACKELRGVAEVQAQLLQPPSVLPHLQAMGYSPAELDEVRACNEVFSAGNMAYVLLATRARLLLEGQDWNTGTGAALSLRTSPVTRCAKPILIEQHHADSTTRDVYADIRATLGLPFVNTDYRAFARWPSCFNAGWADLRQAALSESYEPVVKLVHDKAVALASALPNPSGLTAADLIAAAKCDAPCQEVLEVVKLFQWLLPGLVVNVAFLRAQLAAA
jgi:hypothetical protein